MKHLHFTVPVLIALIVIGVVSTMLWFRSPQFGEWAKNQYFGEIVEIHDTSITLKEKNSKITRIFYSRNTRILKGSHVVGNSGLIRNTPVIVIAEPDEKGELQAKIIRIFAPKKP